MRLSTFNRFRNRPRTTWVESPSSGSSGVSIRRGLQVGQRYHRVDLPTVVWSVVNVYRDVQGVEHATLAHEARRLEMKTLSAAALLDRSRYRLI